MQQVEIFWIGATSPTGSLFLIKRIEVELFKRKAYPKMTHETYGGNPGYRIYEARECNSLIIFE
jgi:hypothetical protein